MSCLEITWLGHSCVVIRSGDVSLITDPFGPSLGIDLGPRDAEIVTVSHPNPHHGHVADMGPDAMVIQGPGEYETANFYLPGWERTVTTRIRRAPSTPSTAYK